MKMLIAAALACAAFALGAAPVEARRVQQPQTGAPALVLDIPDTWGFQYDESGNLIAFNEDRSVAFSVTVAEDAAYGPDQFVQEAAAMAGGAVQRVGAVQVAGVSGVRHRGSIVSGNGMTLSLQIDGARIDPLHMATLSLITRPTTTQQALETASAVIQSARIAR